MLDRLKQLAESAKGILLWIIAPVLAAVGAVSYLFYKNRDLKDEVAQLKNEEATIQDKERVDEADSNAKNMVDQFNDLLGQYRKDPDK